MKNTFFAIAFLSIAAAPLGWAGDLSSLPAAAGNALPKPLKLEDALTYSLDHNPRLKIVREQLRAQQGILVQSVAAAGPNVTANATATDYQNNLLEGGGFSGYDSHKAWTANFLLRQSVFAGGGILAGIRGSYESMRAAKARVTSAVELTVYDLKQAFYSVIVDRQIIGVHQENLKVLQEQLKNVQAKRDAGVSSDFEVLQAKVAVENEKPLLIRAENDYRVASESLLSVLGAPGATDLNPDDVEGELAVEKVSPQLTDLLASAEVHRPDIMAAQRDLEAARSNEWVARATGLPNVSFFASYDWIKDPSVAPMSANINGWEMGVVGTVPLWDSFATAGRILTANAQKRQAAAAELQTRLSVTLEVRQAYSAFDQARQILQSAQTVVDEARESLRLSKARFASGTSTQLDVLQAESALSQARLTLLQAQYDYTVAVAKLEQATGSHDWKVNVEERSAST